METQLRDLLDKIYELEGLVHLALKRDDSLADFIRLISKKGKEVGRLSAQFNLSSENEDKEIPEDTLPIESKVSDLNFSLEEYSIDEDSKEFTSTSSDTQTEDHYYTYTSDNDNEKKVSSVEETSLLDNKRGKLVFSINERFRFRKELFDNSDVDFNNTLALVASMDDYDEAEDYFLNEESFDPSNPVVLEFMKIIKNYFK